MHVLGKVLLGLAIIGAIAATALSAKMLDVRGAWQKQVVDLQKQALTQQQRLEELEKVNSTLRSEIDQLQLGWDNQWTGATVQIVNPQEGTISTNLGRAQGLGSPEGQQLPIVYVFNIDNTGASRYVGAFQVTQLQDNQSSMRLIREPFVNLDPQKYQWSPELLTTNWPRDGVWRIRTMIPPSATERLADLEYTLRVDEDEWERETRRLGAQAELLEQARRLRDYWIAEMVGRDFLPADRQFSPEEAEYLSALAKGYLAAIEEQDAARNSVLSEVDLLRRAVQIATEQIAQLRTENADLAQKLPQPSEPATPATPSQAAAVQP